MGGRGTVPAIVVPLGAGSMRGAVDASASAQQRDDEKPDDRAHEYGGRYYLFVIERSDIHPFIFYIYKYEMCTFATTTNFIYFPRSAKQARTLL